MAGQIGTFVLKKGTQMATKKFLNKQMDLNKDRKPGGQWDPYFEYRPDRKGRMKKVKKQIPDYIPAEDAEILAWVRKWAYRMDVRMSFFGMRFGVGTLIGAIPEVGDAIDILIAYVIYSKCKKVNGGLDRKTKAKMKGWIVANGLIGLVPIVGDLIDASMKANARNCRILEEFLDNKYKPKQLAEQEDAITNERRRHDPNYRPPAPATVYEDFSDDEHNHSPPDYRSRDHTPNGRGHHDRSHDMVETRGNGRSGRSTGHYEESRGGDRRRR